MLTLQAEISLRPGKHQSQRSALLQKYLRKVGFEHIKVDLVKLLEFSEEAESIIHISAKFMILENLENLSPKTTISTLVNSIKNIIADTDEAYLQIQSNKKWNIHIR